MTRLHRILVLRDLGVSLAEIRDLLDEDVTPEQLRGILLLRRAEAEERLADERTRLARVEARIALLEGDTVTDHDVTIKELAPIPVAAATEALAPGDERDVAAALGRLYPRLHQALSDHDVTWDSLSYALYDDLDHNWQEERVTAALGVAPDAVFDDGDVRTVVLPAARAATTIVRGAPQDVYGPAFQAIHDWLAAQGPVDVVQLREVYLDCDGPRDTWVTELQAVLADAP